MKIHNEVLDKIIQFAQGEGYDIHDASFSPITGGEGNIEFLLHLRWQGEKEQGENFLKQSVEEIVQNAHQELKKRK